MKCFSLRELFLQSVTQTIVPVIRTILQTYLIKHETHASGELKHELHRNSGNFAKLLSVFHFKL